nr:MAG: hypothetical protein J07AB56_02140 [Candidatus Nanosalinarum sp. J07AB56]
MLLISEEKDPRYLTIGPERLHQDNFDDHQLPENPPNLDGHALAVAGSPQQQPINSCAEKIDDQYDLDCLICHDENALSQAETNAEVVTYQYGEEVSPSRAADVWNYDRILGNRDVGAHESAVVTTGYNAPRTRREVENMENAEFHGGSVPAETDDKWKDMGTISWDFVSGALRSVPPETEVAGIPIGSLASRVAPYTPVKSVAVEEPSATTPQYDKSMVLGVHVSEDKKEWEGRWSAEKFKAKLDQGSKDELKHKFGGDEGLSYQYAMRHHFSQTCEH